MLRYYYINKEWMLSATARRTYRIAAVLSLLLIPILIVVLALQITSGIPRSLLPAVRMLVLASIVGSATITVAMEYFLFGFDTTSEGKKPFWFLVMLIPSIGAPLYCFLVYSRSDVLKRYQKKRLEETSKQKLSPDSPQSTLQG